MRESANSEYGGSGDSLGAGSDPEQVWTGRVTYAENGGGDSAKIFEKCRLDGKKYQDEFDLVLSNDLEDINQTPIEMDQSSGSRNYRLVVETDPDAVRRHSRSIAHHNAATRSIIEDNVEVTEPDHPGLRDTQTVMVSDDFREYSVDNPGDPRADVYERPYVGAISQKAGTIISYRRDKNQDRAIERAHPSDIMYSIWVHVAGHRFREDVEPLQPHNLLLFIMDQVINPEAAGTCRQIYKSEGIDLDNDYQTRSTVRIVPGDSDNWHALMGTPNIAAVIRMLRDHHRAFRNIKILMVTLKFRPKIDYPLVNDVMVETRQLDPDDNKVVGIWAIGLTLGHDLKDRAPGVFQRSPERESVA